MNKVYYPSSSPPYFDKSTLQIFLAGTIDMGHSRDWQKEVTDRLSIHDNIAIYNPRMIVFEDKYIEHQIQWELNALESSDVIILNFEPNSNSMISLLELGLHARSGKLVVVCPQSYKRYKNVRITSSMYKVNIVESLDDAIIYVESLIKMNRTIHST
jgi:hypothetical protein